MLNTATHNVFHRPSALRCAVIPALLALLSASPPAVAGTGPGVLDPTFSGDGKEVVAFDFGPLFADQVTDAVVQPDGKIVLVGFATRVSPDVDGIVARLNPDGGLDSTFSGDGKIVLALDSGGDDQDFLEAVALQDDGKIVVAGTSDQATGGKDIVVYRFHPNGDLDLDFGNSGGLNIGFDLSGSLDDVASDVLIDANGKIIVAGKAFKNFGADVALVRLTAGGDLDVTFDIDGKRNFGDGSAELEIAAISQTPNNYLLVAATTDGPSGRVCTTRMLLFSGADDIAWNPSGTIPGRRDIDLSLGGNDDRCGDAIVQPDGKIVLGMSAEVDGSDNDDFALVRLLPNGDFDTTFDGDGLAQLPTAFGTGLNQDELLTSLALQPDGKILVGGSVDAGTADTVFGVTRVMPDGTRDLGFGFFGKTAVSFDFLTDDNDTLSKVMLQGGDRIILAGTTDRSEGAGDTDLAVAALTNDLPLFADGFESGDTNAWSTVVP